MAAYTYIAKNDRGKVVESTLDARSRIDALSALKERELTVINLTHVKDKSAEPISKSKARRLRSRKRRSYSSALISLTDRAIFCRQLSVSVSSGVPLREALESIAEDVEVPTLKKVLDYVIDDLHDGQSFSEALSTHAKVFSPLFVALVRAAEESGSLPQVLEHLSFYLERSDKLARKIKSITAYPMFVAVFFCVVCVIMTLFVLPQFQDIFLGFDTELPTLTKVVFGVNAWVIQNIVLLIVGLVGAVAAFALFRRSAFGRYQLDKIKLRLPFFGNCFRKFAIARYCRNLAIMLRGGVPVATAIEIASDVCENQVLQRSLLAIKDNIIAGSDFSSSLAREKEFPRMVVRMVGVGEESGRLPEVLEKVSDVYEDQVEGSIMVATALFEPIIICFFGVMILLLVLAIYMPVFTVGAGVN